MGLSSKQHELLEELREATANGRCIYIRRYSNWDRTAQALANRGLAHVTEPDHSMNRQDGWQAIDHERKAQDDE